MAVNEQAEHVIVADDFDGVRGVMVANGPSQGVGAEWGSLDHFYLHSGCSVCGASIRTYWQDSFRRFVKRHQERCFPPLLARSVGEATE